MKKELPKNIERQCWVCHVFFRTAEGNKKNILCAKHQSKLDRFRYIIFPTYRNKWLGIDLLDDLYSYWHLNIKKRPHFWQDADSTDCQRRWCRYCGRGTNTTTTDKK